MHEKSVLVTAGARRVGAAIVRRLHAAGARVMVHYWRSGAEARALVAALNAQRAGSAAQVKANLLQSSAPALLVNKTLQAFGQGMIHQILQDHARIGFHLGTLNADARGNVTQNYPRKALVSHDEIAATTDQGPLRTVQYSDCRREGGFGMGVCQGQRRSA